MMDFHNTDHLLKPAIIHYQFESIHLDSPILYLSRFIKLDFGV